MKAIRVAVTSFVIALSLTEPINAGSIADAEAYCSNQFSGFWRGVYDCKCLARKYVADNGPFDLKAFDQLAFDAEANKPCLTDDSIQEHAKKQCQGHKPLGGRGSFDCDCFAKRMLPIYLKNAGRPSVVHSNSALLGGTLAKCRVR